MTASRSDILWPTVRGQLASGREPVVYIRPRLDDLQAVLMTARTLAEAYRHIGAPDRKLEAAVYRLSGMVEAADDSRDPVAPSPQAIQSIQRRRDSKRRARRTA